MQQKAIVGTKLEDLDGWAEERILALGGTPYNKGYKPEWAEAPFPKTVCICVNDMIAHGIPDQYELKEGDLVSFDVGVSKDGECGDAAFTMGIGKINHRDERLLWNAKKVLYAGIAEVKAGVVIRDISRAMEQTATRNGFITNRIFSGHTISRAMHESPLIPAFVPSIETADQTEHYNAILTEGQMICLEPMLTYTDPYGYRTSDNWTQRTNDMRKSAFFEHQLLVTADGCEILTQHIDK